MNKPIKRELRAKLLSMSVVREQSPQPQAPQPGSLSQLPLAHDRHKTRNIGKIGILMLKKCQGLGTPTQPSNAACGCAAQEWHGWDV